MIEISEFTGMIRIGAGPQRSAFLSSFFTLVGCHGAHVTAGLLWIGPGLISEASRYLVSPSGRFLLVSSAGARVIVCSTCVGECWNWL